MAKRLWSSLAPSTKARYKRYGVSPQQYNAGKISAGFRQTIMGKGGDSFAVQRAKQAALDKVVPDFNKLPKKQREQMADLWLKGRTEPIRPITYGPGGTFAVEPVDTSPDNERHYGKPLINVDIVEAQMTLDDWFHKIGADEMTDDDWKAFKLAYNASFTRG
jgi:hypothetical protein